MEVDSDDSQETEFLRNQVEELTRQIAQVQEAQREMQSTRSGEQSQNVLTAEDFDTARKLLGPTAQVATVMPKDAGGMTPLHRAARCAHEGFVEAHLGHRPKCSVCSDISRPCTWKVDAAHVFGRCRPDSHALFYATRLLVLMS